MLKDFNKEFNKYQNNLIIKEKKWDMLFLGMNYNYKYIKKKLSRIEQKVTGAYAVAISDKIINEYEYLLRKFNCYIDTIPYQILKKKYKIYGIYPNLIIPKIGDSDIDKRKNDKKLKFLNNWKIDKYTE